MILGRTRNKKKNFHDRKFRDLPDDEEIKGLNENKKEKNKKKIRKTRRKKNNAFVKHFVKLFTR